MSKYDFESDDWPDGERVSYKLMRWWFLSNCYTYCQAKIQSDERWNKGWASNEHEIGYAWEQLESAFSLPIENLMLEIICLVLNAGRGPKQFELITRERITQILSEHNLQDLLKELPKEEREEFERDLKLLKVMT